MSLYVRRTLPLPRQMHTRSWSTKAHITSASVRKHFKDFFVNDNNHTFVPSSLLRPLCDPTVPFVNAGMNQFKTILQGHTEPPWTRVTNYQKCARVGGKHNDLDIVGSDGYHHTFFEMLGNWSFGDYSKKEACKMAWDLLLGPYRLNPNQLYVTYFGGDEGLNIAADLECREIWLELGVKESHILPFGLNDNFWEMGITGPCGPCTEIHVDHIPGRSSAPDRVNAGFSDLTELWNIVFIQYDRNIDGSLTSLGKHHIDTGMGFERLVALLNGFSSNYNTDIFLPLFDIIHKETDVPIYSGSFEAKDDDFERDCLYRVLSDHTRLLTVALADGIFPSHQYKLRWVLRKCMRILSSHFYSNEKLLIELTKHVADKLSDVYPEVAENLPKVHALISNEADIYKSLLSSLPKKWHTFVKTEPKLENLLLMGSNPNAIVSAYEKVTAVKGQQELPSSLSILLYESLGMSPGLIRELCDIVGLKFDENSHLEELTRYKKNSKLSSAQGPQVSNLAKTLISAHIPYTVDSLKYDYIKNSENYTFPDVNATIVALVDDGTLKEKLDGELECGVVLDRTNFYHTAGGQVNDTGLITSIVSEKSFLTVKDVRQDSGYVIHFGSLTGGLEVGDVVRLKINAKDRIKCMRNHTLAHLLNGTILKLYKATSQEGCLVQPDFLKLTYNLHGEEINDNDIEVIEEEVREAVQECIPVKRYTVNRWGVPPGTTFLPDTFYPVENMHILDILKKDTVLSREPCCGTHVHNTGDCGTICITEVIKHSKDKCSVCAVSGTLAEKSLNVGQKIRDDVEKFCKDVEDFLNSGECKALLTQSETEQCSKKVRSSVQRLLSLFKRHDDISALERKLSRRLPYTVFVKAEESLQKVFKSLDRFARIMSEHEVLDAAKNVNYLVYDVQSLHYLDSIRLYKITRNIHIPVMLFCASKIGEVKIRCCVPQAFVSSDFNAKLWLEQVKECFPPEKRTLNISSEHLRSDPKLISSVSSIKTHVKHTRKMIMDAMEAASAFAQSRLPASK